MSASVQLGCEQAPVEKPPAWTRAWFRYWLFEKPVPVTEPYIGPGYCPNLAQLFGKGSIPPRPVPRNCSAMLPPILRNTPVAIVIPDDSAGVPWTLVRQPTRAAPLPQASKFEVPADRETTSADQDLPIAAIMQKLVLALEHDPIPATVIRPAPAQQQASDLVRTFDLASRLATVASLNKPRKANRSTPLKSTALVTKRTRPLIAAVNKPLAIAPIPASVPSIDALVAEAASNVVRLVAGNTPLAPAMPRNAASGQAA
jgi:hypothetical protein